MNETIEQWAARVATTWKHWLGCECIVDGALEPDVVEAAESAMKEAGHHGPPVIAARALVARRDAVAQSLTVPQRRTIRYLVHTRHRTSKALVDRGLLASNPTYMDGFRIHLTDFGHEVARILETR